jgi:phosphoribosyl 1,2-cyclic phosphate phosphodiesterase
MQLTFLGTGTSGGVPSIGCNCKVCRSEDPRDKRLRCSALLEEGDTRILIDCGPDFRQQILPWDFRKMDGILLTHIHYDHVAGIDDIRPFCVFGAVPVYADEKTARGLRHTMPYCFAEHPYPGVPLLELHVVEPNIPFVIGGIEVMPIQVMHGKLSILGFRFGKLAYITDMKTIAPDQLPYLKGVETLVVNALRLTKEHHSHQLLDDAVAFAQQLGAKTTYLIHVTHDIGLHRETEKMLQGNIHLAYDNLKITI